MSQIHIDAKDLDTLIKKYLSPKASFCDGRIQLEIPGGSVTLDQPVLNTGLHAEFQGLQLRAEQAKFDAQGLKLNFQVG